MSKRLFNAIYSINIPLHEPGRILKEKILDGFKLTSTQPSTSSATTSSSTPFLSTIRLISRGKVLDDNEPIQNQGIRNGSVVMVLLGAGVEVSFVAVIPFSHFSLPSDGATRDMWNE